MTVEQVKLTLANEAKLLQHMIENVGAYKSEDFTKQALFIQGSWGRFLGERRKTNLELCSENPDAMKTNLKNERAQIVKYLDQTDSDPQYTEYWKSFLECEISILDHLIKLCDEK